jgi:hypothetical protein
LPIFPLRITDEGEAIIEVGGTDLPLGDIVQRLLTRRIQHRQYLANGQPSDATVEAAPMDCYRCKEQFGVLEPCRGERPRPGAGRRDPEGG